MAKVRRVNVEGSTFGLRRAKGSVKSKEKFSTVEGEGLQKRRRASVKSKENTCQLQTFSVTLPPK
ncbi:MAG: hypothetical protein II415_01145, partial [Bacteroidaceae bacterium]|nr:hypothetical protein [Bacteroidaceae bacterium]